MFCGKCGTKINDGDSYCTNCGAKVLNGNKSSNSNNNSNQMSLSEQVKYAKTVKRYKSDTHVDEMDTVKFGAFPQNSVNDSEKEPIEWLVLEKNSGEAFLLSKFVLEFKEFGKFDDYREDYPCWDNSKIRKWLNGEFFNNSFNSSEREMIKETEIFNVPDPNYNYDGESNYDRIFLLSDMEIETYFEQTSSEGANENIKCTTRATTYSKRYDSYGWFGGLVAEEREQDVWWAKNDSYWLRTKGKSQPDILKVNVDGTISGSSADNGNYGIRPAMWVKI